MVRTPDGSVVPSLKRSGDDLQLGVFFADATAFFKFFSDSSTSFYSYHNERDLVMFNVEDKPECPEE